MQFGNATGIYSPQPGVRVSYLVRTQDRGKTWSYKRFPDQVSNITSSIDGQRLLLTLRGTNAVSLDGGDHWMPVALPFQECFQSTGIGHPGGQGTFIAVNYSPRNCGHGPLGTVFGLGYSLDDGLSWTLRTLSGRLPALATGTVDQTILIMSPDTILRLDPHGENPIFFTTGLGPRFMLGGVLAIPGGSLFAVSFSYSSEYVFQAFSPDNTKLVEHLFTVPISMPVFVTSNIGFILSPPILYRTENRGISWTPVLDNLSNHISHLPAFFSENYGLIISKTGSYQSTDRGMTWTRLPQPPWLPVTVNQ